MTSVGNCEEKWVTEWTMTVLCLSAKLSQPISSKYSHLPQLCGHRCRTPVPRSPRHRNSILTPRASTPPAIAICSAFRQLQCTWHRWPLWLLGHYRTASLPTTRHPEHMPCLGLPSLQPHPGDPGIPALSQNQILTQGDAVPCSAF